jgi:TRAP-type transport system small permease protein
MDRTARHIHSSARIVALIGFFGLLLLAAITTLDVLMRWLFQAPIHGVNDISSVVMAIVIAACIPANLAMKQNITVEVLGSLGSPRLHRFFDALASMATLIFVVLVAWRFVPYSEGLRQTGDRTWVLGWQLWPWWMASAALMIFAAIVQFVVTLADLRALFLGIPAGKDADSDEPGRADTIF